MGWVVQGGMRAVGGRDWAVACWIRAGERRDGGCRQDLGGRTTGLVGCMSDLGGRTTGLGGRMSDLGGCMSDSGGRTTDWAVARAEYTIPLLNHRKNLQEIYRFQVIIIN